MDSSSDSESAPDSPRRRSDTTAAIVSDVQRKVREAVSRTGAAGARGRAMKKAQDLRDSADVVHAKKLDSLDGLKLRSLSVLCMMAVLIFVHSFLAYMVLSQSQANTQLHRVLANQVEFAADAVLRAGRVGDVADFAYSPRLAPANATAKLRWNHRLLLSQMVRTRPTDSGDGGISLTTDSPLSVWRVPLSHQALRMLDQLTPLVRQVVGGDSGSSDASLTPSPELSVASRRLLLGYVRFMEQVAGDNSAQVKRGTAVVVGGCFILLVVVTVLAWAVIIPALVSIRKAAQRFLTLTRSVARVQRDRLVHQKLLIGSMHGIAITHDLDALVLLILRQMLKATRYDCAVFFALSEDGTSFLLTGVHVSEELQDTDGTGSRRLSSHRLDELIQVPRDKDSLLSACQRTGLAMQVHRDSGDWAEFFLFMADVLDAPLTNVVALPLMEGSARLGVVCVLKCQPLYTPERHRSADGDTSPGRSRGENTPVFPNSVDPGDSASSDEEGWVSAGTDSDTDSVSTSRTRRHSARRHRLPATLLQHLDLLCQHACVAIRRARLLFETEETRRRLEVVLDSISSTVVYLHADGSASVNRPADLVNFGLAENVEAVELATRKPLPPPSSRPSRCDHDQKKQLSESVRSASLGSSLRRRKVSRNSIVLARSSRAALTRAQIGDYDDESVPSVESPAPPLPLSRSGSGRSSSLSESSHSSVTGKVDWNDSMERFRQLLGDQNDELFTDMLLVQSTSSAIRRPLASFKTRHGRTKMLSYSISPLLNHADGDDDESARDPSVIISGHEGLQRSQGVVLTLDDVTEREHAKFQLARYLSPAVAKKVLEDDSGSHSLLLGVQQQVSVMFCDLRSFTEISEQLSSDSKRLVALLNSFFNCVVNEVEAAGGIVDKFIGDAAMAVFGVPYRRDCDAGYACKCALAVIESTKRLNSVRELDGLPPIRCGIGINTGTAVAGNIGSERRLQYTVVGDAVNLASRVEGLSKAYAVDIIVTEDTKMDVDNCCPGEEKPFVFRELDTVRVKGRTRATRIFELRPTPAPSATSDDIAAALAHYADGLRLYRAGQFSEAATAFGAGASVDPACLAMEQRCLRFESNPGLVRDWDGVHSFLIKF